MQLNTNRLLIDDELLFSTTKYKEFNFSPNGTSKPPARFPVFSQYC